MDDIIFEKDYRETESAEYDKWCDEVFDRAVNCGMLKAYSEAMDKIPKIIVPEDKKNYLRIQNYYCRCTYKRTKSKWLWI